MLALAVLTVAGYLAVLPRAFFYLRGPFTPALAAFSFPLINSALAAGKAGEKLGSIGAAGTILRVIGTAELIPSLAILCVLLCRFAAAIVAPQTAAITMKKETES